MSFNKHVFAAMLHSVGLPEPTPEWVFAPPRKFRFDFAWPESNVALEVEGGVFTQGRHTRARGFLVDMEKYNLAVMHGWRLVRCTPSTLCTDATVEMLGKLMDRTAVVIGADYAERHPGAIVTRLMSAPELATACDVSLSTATLWITRDRLPCFDVMGRPFVDHATLFHWLSHTTAVSPAVRARLEGWMNQSESKQ